MRCEHIVPGRGFLRWREREHKCGARLKSLSRKRLIGLLTWHVYRCRRGHETRFYLRP